MTDLYKKWRGLAVDPGLKDEWLERMNSIPGIAITHTCEGHIGDERIGGRYPNLRFQARWEESKDEIARAFEEFAIVERFPEGFIITSRSERADMSEREYDAWWDRVISILEDSSKKHFQQGAQVPGTSVEDLEREIIEGGASVLAWKARTPTLKRRENILYYDDYPPEVWNETVEFFREIERLNNARLYDVFLASAGRQGIADLPNTRKWFGMAAAQYGIAYFNHININYIEGVVIPDWVDFLEGPYAACVFWSTNPAISGRFVVLVANQRTALWMGISMAQYDGRIVIPGGQDQCHQGTLEIALQQTPIPENIDRRCQDSMSVSSLLDFLTESVSFEDKKTVRRRFTESLAECFQAS